MAVTRNIEPHTKEWLESLPDEDFCVPVEAYPAYDKCRLCGSVKLPGSDNAECPDNCPNCIDDK